MTQPNLLALTLVGTLLSCAAQAPSELVSARHAYENANLTEAPTLVPKELHEARVALDQAEYAFDKDPRGFHTADLAYVAERKAQMAVAASTIARAKTDSVQATGDLADIQEQIVAQGKLDLDAEQKARMDAEAREQAALAALANVKKEDRGMVVTLSGSVLFKSGESTLLPDAQSRLGDVSKALMETKDRSLVVEGHTDSQGTDVSNQQLSQRRAEAVKGYLVSAGYSGSLIDAQGMGEVRPVADNETAEGRANNRRVEIVIKP